MWWSDGWPEHWMIFVPLMLIFFVILCAAMVVLMMSDVATSRRLPKPHSDNSYCRT